MNALKDPQPSPANKAETHSFKTQSRPRILLAEDCSVTALLIKEMLQQYGYNVTVTCNGNTALDTLSRSAFDFVLMDLEMPVMDGFETCRRLRAGRTDGTNSSIPVIGMSVHPTALLRNVALQIGMHDVLEKPLDFDLLIGILQSLETKADAHVLQTTEPGVEESSTPVVLAKERALERLAGAETLYEDMLRKLRDVLPQKHNTIADALACNDYKTVEITAHSLAGSLGSVGAQKCMLEAKKLCVAARTRDAYALQSGFNEFANALQTFMCCLENELS